MMPTMERTRLHPIGVTQVKPRWMLDESLVLYLPLWNISGDVFLSDDAYGHTVTRTGATATGQGGMSFDGGDDYLTISPAAFANMTDCTLMVWAKYKTKASDAAMFAYYGDANNRFNPYVSTATKKVMHEIVISSTGYSVGSDNAITAGEWYQAAFILGSMGMKLALNGKMQSATNTTSYSFANITGTELSIARLGALGIYWQDYIGEVSIYNRALTAQEILNLYNATRGKYGGG